MRCGGVIALKVVGVNCLLQKLWIKCELSKGNLERDGLIFVPKVYL